MQATHEILEICQTVNELVLSHDDEDFSWEDAIAQLNLPSETAIIVLAILSVADRTSSVTLSEQVRTLLC